MPQSIRDRSEAAQEGEPDTSARPPSDPTLPRAQLRYIGPPNGASYDGNKLEQGKTFAAPAIDAEAMVTRWPHAFAFVDEMAAREAIAAQRKMIEDAVGVHVAGADLGKESER